MVILFSEHSLIFKLDCQKYYLYARIVHKNIYLRMRQCKKYLKTLQTSCVWLAQSLNKDKLINKAIPQPLVHLALSPVW